MIWITRFMTAILLVVTSFVEGLASLEVSVVTQGSSTCQGEISVTADGTAGPFEIRLSADGLETQTFANVDGTITIGGLCAIDYQIEAVNRFGCSHDLGQLLFGSGTNAREGRELEMAQAASETLRVVAMPNPFKHVFALQVRSERSGPLEVMIYDALGCRVFSRQQDVVAGKNELSLDLHGIKTGQGMLMLEVIDVRSGWRSFHRLLRVGE